ncbi:MAG: type II and III secretion system protein family protein [Pseudomonadota bacterium]
MKQKSPIAWVFAACLAATVPAAPVHSQGLLRVMDGEASSSITVNTNRAVVLESEQPFAELSVANPAIADVATLSDRTIYILGKAPGRTTLTLLGSDGRLITNVDLQVEPDLQEFKERLKAILPGENIEVRTAAGGIVLSGNVSSTPRLNRALELAERYAPQAVSNLMTVGGSNQVMLKVRFAEMNRSVSKQLGSSIGFSAGQGDFTSAGETGTFLSGDNTPFGDVVVGDDTQGAFRLGFSSGSFAIEVLIEALETKGLVRTLAEPNLVALSGQEASFLAGGEFPIPVSSDDGISVEYRPFGVQLTFLPTVLDDGNINVAITAAVSEIDTTIQVDTGTSTAFAFTERSTSTIVELKDGQSLSIAGLLQDDFRDASAQVPWLGDIPILGALFRSADYTREQTELVIIITPHLVTPVDGDLLSLPTDRIQPPSEAELFLLGRTTGKPGTVEGQDFSGSYGYVLE